MTDSPAELVIQNIKHEDVEVERLNIHPKNPRQGDFGAIYELIKENGFYGELIVQILTRGEDGEPAAGLILAGNHRYRAAVELGYKKLPVAWVDVPPIRQLKILLGDNRSTDLADNDPVATAEVLQMVYDEDASFVGTGYDEDDYDQIRADIEYDEVAAIEGTEERQWSPEERYEKQYMSTELRQIIVVMHQDEYAWALAILREMQQVHDQLENNSEAILLLLKRWKEEIGEGEAGELRDGGALDAEDAAAPDSLGRL